jgi:hypothetical protein
MKNCILDVDEYLRGGKQPTRSTPKTTFSCTRSPTISPEGRVRNIHPDLEENLPDPVHRASFQNGTGTTSRGNAA